MGMFILPVQPAAALSTNQVQVVVVQGTVEVARAGQSVWDMASTQRPYCLLNPGDQVRTKDRSRAAVRLSDLTIVELGPNSHLEVLRPETRRPGLSLLKGLLHLFHRDDPGEFYFRTPTASPVIRGTEFALEVAEDGATTLQLLEGDVALTNEFGQLDLATGQAARVEASQPPTRTASLPAVNVIQWCLYYPGVLDPQELQLSPEENQALVDSLKAYHRGDLVAALALYPAGRAPGSDQEKVYLAALLLAVGEASQAEALLKGLTGTDSRAAALAMAVRTLIAAVKYEARPQGTQQPGTPQLASTQLAESYYQQSRFDLVAALDLARAAVAQSAGFAFGWARVAELEFSFGHWRRAREAVERALELAPRNAQAMALKGFVLAAQNRLGAALAQFDAVLAVDGALGNAWLGRGLCRIREGDLGDGAADLLVAAALEPNRALLRSYLGKAFASEADDGRGARELGLAKQLDPNDPTSWLYAALLNQQRNRINDAIRDLERSEELNNKRRLYRSRLLLDQDLAVRQANLASVYQDAGMSEQSVREAARALTSDYANYSAHLFLANSYSQLRDVDFINLRYETIALSEYLVAQLLAPVGGNNLSPYVSQQEYSRLFERRGFGLSSGTEYTSRGDWRESAAQYGTFEHFDYALDAFYASQNGQQPNNDFTLRSFSAASRVEVTPQDTLFIQAVTTTLDSGDLRQYFDPAQADRGLRIKDSQEPNLFIGYHRQWAPGSHTLLLAGRLSDDFHMDDAGLFVPTLRLTPAGTIYSSLPPVFSQFTNEQHAEFVAYTAELQQLWQTGPNSLVVGGRYQDGDTESEFLLSKLPPSFGNLLYPNSAQQADTQLRRGVIYAYDDWQVFEPLWLIGGVSYDWLSFPANIDLPPITAQQEHKDKVSPKAGLVWTPADNVVVRGAYTRSLGGLYFDNSVRLEPAQVGGFNQTFRSLIPESVAGLVPGTEFETGDVDFSWRFKTGTYLGAGAEWLRSDGERSVGVFESSVFLPQVTAAQTPERLQFEEKSVSANLDQLLGRDWALGAHYRVSHADLNERLLNVPPTALRSASQTDSALLHQLILLAKYAHPCGFFAEAQGVWYAQENENLPDQDFWQLNLLAGYRFAQRRIEFLVGGLNLTDQDYRLNPLNLHAELPRTRTLLVSFKFNF